MKIYTYDESFCYNGFFESPEFPPAHDPVGHSRITDKPPPASGPFQDVIFDPNTNDWAVTAEKPEKRQHALNSAFSQKMREVNEWLDNALSSAVFGLSPSECAVVTMFAGEIRSEAAGTSGTDPFLNNYLRAGKTRLECAEALCAKMDRIASESAGFIAQADDWRDEIQQIFDAGDIDALEAFAIN